jgi:hypothetical protein
VVRLEHSAGLGRSECRESVKHGECSGSVRDEIGKWEQRDS